MYNECETFYGIFVYKSVVNKVVTTNISYLLNVTTKYKKKYIKLFNFSTYQLFNYLITQLLRTIFQSSYLSIFLIVLFLLNFYSLSFADYSRIVSLAPSVTESLYELGIDKELIATTIYCSNGKFKKEIVGTVTEPNIEKIVSLKPDLVIATKEGNYQSVVDKMIKLKLNVYVMEPYLSFDDICNNFQKLADYLNKKEVATKIIKDVKKEILQINNELKKSKKEKIFWEVGTNPIFTVGKQSFVNEYNKFINGINIFENINMRYPNVSIESVIEKNPDIIILVNMGNVSEQELNKWNKYKNISAIKNKRIHMLEPNDIFIPTPKKILKGIKILQSKI